MLIQTTICLINGKNKSRTQEKNFDNAVNWAALIELSRLRDVIKRNISRQPAKILGKL